MLYLHDLVPMVEVGDGFATIEAIFTKEAINNFRKLNNHLKLANL